MFVATCIACAMIVTPFAANLLGRTNTARIDGVLRQIDVAILAAARIGAAQIETVRIVRTVLEFWIHAFVKVYIERRVERIRVKISNQ